MFKKFFILLVVAAVLVTMWFSFAIWAGIYSVYTVAPVPPDNKGATYIVSREEGEPAFNSPEYVAPPSTPEKGESGMGFSSMKKAKRPIEMRTIVKLPYVDWAYQKSVEKPDSLQAP